jgi:hypothetical protein
MFHVADRWSLKRSTTQGREMPDSSGGFLQDSLWEFASANVNDEGGCA